MNRASLLANIPAVLRHLKIEGHDEAAGQGGLFGSTAIEELELRELPEMTDEQKMHYERKLLGGFITMHPVTHLLDPAVLAKRSHRCRQRFDMEQAGTSARIVVVGLVRHWEDYGNGGTLQVEDETGPLFIKLFRREAERYQWILRQDHLLALRLIPRYGVEKTDLVLQEAKKLGQFNGEEYDVPPDPREKKSKGPAPKRMKQPAKKKARR